MKRFIIAYYVVAMFVSCGCGATESTRRVNVHNRLAAEWIAGVSEDAQIDEAALLIAAGSTVLEAELKSPENPPLKYDPISQREDIEKAKKDIEDKAGLIDTVFNFAQTTAGKITGALGLGALGFTIIGWVRSAAWSGKLWTYAKTAGAVLGKYKDLREEVAEKAAARGVSKEVHKVVEALPPATPPPAPEPPKP